MKPGQVKYKHPDFGTTVYGTEEQRDAVLGKSFTPVAVAESTESVFPEEEGKVYSQVSGKLVTQAEADAEAEATAEAREAQTKLNQDALDAQAAPKSKSAAKKS